jgi:geranylgeranyl pyrophosphate synthase
VHKLFGDAAAINSGIYVYFKAFLSLLDQLQDKSQQGELTRIYL